MSDRDIMDCFEEITKHDGIKCKLCKRRLNIGSDFHSRRKHYERVHLNRPNNSQDGIETSSLSPVRSKKRKSMHTVEPRHTNQRDSPLTLPSASRAIPSTSNTASPIACTSGYRNCATEDGEIRRQTLVSNVVNLIINPLPRFSFAEGEDFRRMMETIKPLLQTDEVSQIVEPEFHATMRSTINDLYESTKTEIRYSLKNVLHVSLSIDAWTGENERRFATVTCHFINDDWELRHLTLDIIPMTESGDVDFKQNVGRIIEEYEIGGKIVATTHHHAIDVMSGSGGLLGVSVKCLAHVIQSCLSNGLTGIPQIDTVVKKCSSLVDYIKYSSYASEALRAYQIQLPLPLNELIPMEPTRCSSIYKMLDRIKEQKDAVLDVLNNTPSESARALVPTPNDWKVICELIDVLREFETACCVISKVQYPTASIIVPLIRQFNDIYLKRNATNPAVSSDRSEYNTDQSSQSLQSSQSNHEPSDLRTITKLKENLEREFKQKFVLNFDEASTEGEKMLFLSTFFNLRSKRCVQDIPALQEMIRREIDLVGPAVQNRVHMTTPNYDTLFQDHRDLPIDEMDEYLKVCLKENEKITRDDVDILRWWKSNSSTYPALSKLAKKYLCISATSLPAEQIFSAAGDKITKWRSCLSFNESKILVFLHDNCKLSDVSLPHLENIQ